MTTSVGKALMYCPQCRSEYPEEHRSFETECLQCFHPRPLNRTQILKALKLGKPVTKVIPPLFFYPPEIQGYDISAIYDGLLEVEEKMCRFGLRKNHSEKECEAYARLIASNKFKSFTVDNSFEHGASLADAFKNVKSIEKLEITRTPKGVEHIAAGIRDNKSIKTLNITSYTHPEVLDPLFKAIENNKTVRKLTASHLQNISSKTIESIKQMLIGNITLTSIDFINLDSSCGWKVFAEGLKATRCRLNNIKLHECNINTTDTEYIFDALEAHPTITKVELISAPIKGTYGHLNKLLKNNTVMEFINLGGAKMEISGLNELVDGIRSNKKLKSFNIDLDAPIEQEKTSSEDIKPFFNALKENSTLKEFQLTGFVGNDDGAKCIIDTLTDHMSIEAIELAYNTFSKATGQYLFNRLRYNTTLKSINFAMPVNEPKMYKLLASAIRSNKTLTCMYITGCKPSLEDFEKICAALKENQTLKSIRIGEEFDDQPGPINAVLDLFTVNYSLTWISLVRHHDFSAFLQRNKDYQKEKYQETAVLLHNIRRNKKASKLPIEIWILIFKFLKYPGLTGFEELAKRILLPGIK